MRPLGWTRAMRPTVYLWGGQTERQRRAGRAGGRRRRKWGGPEAAPRKNERGRRPSGRWSAIRRGEGNSRGRWCCEQAVCAGFLFAIDVADKFIKTGSARCALVVGAETFSRIIDWTDRTTCVLFGDGAGAVVLRAADEPGIYSTHLHSDGKYKDLLCVPVGVSRNFKQVNSGSAFTTMEGGEVFRWAVTAMSDIVDETLDANGMSRDDIDWLIPHQANIRIINAVGKRAKIPPEKVIVTVERHGNTSAASVPLALDEAVRDGRIKSGQNVLIEGFGGGFTWGSALVKM